MRRRWPNALSIAETPELDFLLEPQTKFAAVPSSFRRGVGAQFRAVSWRYVFSYAGLLTDQLPIQKSLSEGSVLINELTYYTHAALGNPSRFGRKFEAFRLVESW
jgi:hypothetical protein